MNIHDFKLKHLDSIAKENVDYLRLLIEVGGYENTWFNRHFGIVRMTREVSKIVYTIQNLDPKKLKYEQDCIIKNPQIDNIPFIARLELTSLIQNNSEENMITIMSSIIAITTYYENVGKDFDIESTSYLKYKSRIENESAIYMIGLYNTIMEDLDESDKGWHERFLSVQVEDEEYEMAGGARMNQFNVINTIKSTCQDFNIGYKEAWQMSYIIVQSNSYSKATSAHIQNSMTRLKEQKFKRQRSKHG